MPPSRHQGCRKKRRRNADTGQAGPASRVNSAMGRTRRWYKIYAWFSQVYHTIGHLYDALLRRAQDRGELEQRRTVATELDAPGGERPERVKFLPSNARPVFDATTDGD